MFDSLSHNELDYTACTAVAKMLTVNQHIKCLDLSHNPLSNAGAVQLATGIKNNAILEILEYVITAVRKHILTFTIVCQSVLLIVMQFMHLLKIYGSLTVP